MKELSIMVMNGLPIYNYNSLKTYLRYYLRIYELRLVLFYIFYKYRNIIYVIPRY